MDILTNHDRVSMISRFASRFQHLIQRYLDLQRVAYYLFRDQQHSLCLVALSMYLNVMM